MVDTPAAFDIEAAILNKDQFMSAFLRGSLADYSLAAMYLNNFSAEEVNRVKDDARINITERIESMRQQNQKERSPAAQKEIDSVCQKSPDF